MTKEITYDNFDGLCPLITAGWKPLHHDNGITLTLYTRQDGIPVDIDADGVRETLPGAIAQ